MAHTYTQNYPPPLPCGTGSSVNSSPSSLDIFKRSVETAGMPFIIIIIPLGVRLLTWNHRIQYTHWPSVPRLSAAALSKPAFWQKCINKAPSSASPMASLFIWVTWSQKPRGHKPARASHVIAENLKRSFLLQIAPNNNTKLPNNKTFFVTMNRCFYIKIVVFTKLMQKKLLINKIN